MTRSPAQCLAPSLSIILALITLGAATQSIAVGVILFLAVPALLVVNVQVAWHHRPQKVGRHSAVVATGRHARV